MEHTLRVLIVQMTSTNSHAGNIETVCRCIEEAADKDCNLVALPEAAGMMNRDQADAMQKTQSEEDDPFIAECRQGAIRHGLWIHVGSTPVQENNKLLNHSVLVDPRGEIRARYDKIHLFDIFLEGRPAARESDRYTAGRQATVVDTPWGTWGLSICYDLRFPHLYRDFAKCGATVMFAPSAFTVPTGRAHWETLIRSRAIENGCWFIAAAQVGHHDDGRTTYGHSLVVDPWGVVVADLGGDAPGNTVVDIDPRRAEATRRQIPSLTHDRPYKLVHHRLLHENVMN